MSVDSAQLGAFLAALIALVASPGPATLGLAAAGAAFGFRAARVFLAGLLCGAALTIFLVGSGVVSALLAHPIVAPILTGLAALYMAYLAYRIATAPPLGEKAAKGRIPGFLPGFMLAVANPKAYAVFATLFSGFAVIPDDVTGNALLKGYVIMALLTAIDSSWLYVGSSLRHLFHDPKVSRRINIAFAVLLLISVVLAVGV
jgi:threonine/homoserine/homoserine lactone efflux protein